MPELLRQFIEALNGTTETLFYIANERIYRRVDDTDAGQAEDLTVTGVPPLHMARFTGAYAGAQDCLYATFEDGSLRERVPGGTWSVCTLPAGFGAHFLEVIGDELWAADRDRSVIRKCTADPKVAGSWSGPILIGTPSAQISALKQSSNHLAIFKSDGHVFNVTATGDDVDLFPGLEATQDIDNARTVSSWLGSLWFRIGRAFYQLDQSGTPVLAPRGPGRNLGNLSEVRGPVQCFAGWNTQMAFAVIFNAELSNSYLLSYGSWVPKADPDQAVPTNVSGTAYSFVDQYDGALVRWPNRRATAMYVSNIPNEARLYVGWSEGTYDWIKLVPYPLLPGQGAEYTLDESYIVLPLHHAMFQSDNKHWTGASLFGPQMGTGNSASLTYRVSGSSVGASTQPLAGNWRTWSATQRFLQIGQRLNPEPPIAGKALELKLSLSNTTIDGSPILEGLGVHERLVPAFRRDYTMTINANEYIARRDGASTRQSGVTIRKWLENAASAPASIALELPDETLNDVALFSYEERMVPHTQRGGQGFAISVQATQFTVLQVYGTIGRTRGTLIGDTRGMMISDMRFF